jgi:hypothetical protein
LAAVDPHKNRLGSSFRAIAQELVDEVLCCAAPAEKKDGDASEEGHYNCSYGDITIRECNNRERYD